MRRPALRALRQDVPDVARLAAARVVAQNAEAALPERQAEAIRRALVMPPEERASRAAMLRRVVEENSVEKWVQAQFADMAAKLGGDA